MVNIDRKKELVFLGYRLGYIFTVAFYLFTFLIPGVAILDTFDENIKHVKQAEGKVYFLKGVPYVNKVGIELSDGTRILFHCDAGLLGTNNYYCLRNYSFNSEANAAMGKKAKAEWFEQDIPFRPHTSNMLLSLSIEGEPAFPSAGILDMYKRGVGSIKTLLVGGFLFVVFSMVACELYLRRVLK